MNSQTVNHVLNDSVNRRFFRLIIANSTDTLLEILRKHCENLHGLHQNKIRHTRLQEYKNIWLYSCLNLNREFFCELHMFAVLAVFVLANLAEGFLYAVDKFVASYGLKFKIPHATFSFMRARNLFTLQASHFLS